MPRKNGEKAVELILHEAPGLNSLTDQKKKWKRTEEVPKKATRNLGEVRKGTLKETETKEKGQSYEGSTRS